MSTRRKNVYVFMSVCFIFLLSGCEVPTQFKADAFDIEGEYRVDRLESAFGAVALTESDKFFIENETAVYDIRMVVVRSAFIKMEEDLFRGVTVKSEADFLRQRLLLGAGYRELDSGDFFESRENISKDNGRTGMIKIATRFYKLRPSAFHHKFIFSKESKITKCVVTCNDEKKCDSISRSECIEFAEKGSLGRQAFRYHFLGSIKRNETTIHGAFGLETTSHLRFKEFKVYIGAVLWESDLELIREGNLGGSRLP